MPDRTENCGSPLADVPVRRGTVAGRAHG